MTIQELLDELEDTPDDQRSYNVAIFVGQTDTFWNIDKDDVLYNHEDREVVLHTLYD